MIKKLTTAAIVTTLLLFTTAATIQPAHTVPYQESVTDKASDSYIRNAVIKLTSPSGQCTGVQIKAGSKLKVLTAAHCIGLVIDGKVRAQGEDGATVDLDFIAEDNNSDLMLLSGSDKFGSIDVAQSLRLYDKVHSMTHGAGAATFRMDGEALDEVSGGFMIGEVYTPEEVAECVKHKKYTIELDMSGMICVLNVQSLRSTAQALPGSSGGPLVNAAGELVGIVSYGNTRLPLFAYYVRLVDIQAFISATVETSR